MVGPDPARVVDEEPDELVAPRVVAVRRVVEVEEAGHDGLVVLPDRVSHPRVVDADPPGPVVVEAHQPADRAGGAAHAVVGSGSTVHPVVAVGQPARSPPAVPHTSASSWPIRPSEGPAGPTAPVAASAADVPPATVAEAGPAGRLAAAPHTEAATASRVHAVATHHLCRLVMAGHHTTWPGVVVGRDRTRPGTSRRPAATASTCGSTRVHIASCGRPVAGLR